MNEAINRKKISQSQPAGSYFQQSEINPTRKERNSDILLISASLDLPHNCKNTRLGLTEIKTKTE